MFFTLDAQLYRALSTYGLEDFEDLSNVCLVLPGSTSLLFLVPSSPSIGMFSQRRYTQQKPMDTTIKQVGTINTYTTTSEIG